MAIELDPELPATPAVQPQPSDNLGFSLNFMSGKGLLSLSDRNIGPFHLKTLELEIPELSFPFDVTGGSEKFKTRRCKLRHLVFGMDGEHLVQALREAPLVEAGFQEIRPIIRDGHIEFSGRFAIGDHSADFTFRAAMLLRSRSEMGVVFYDARVYGWLPIPSALLPVYLERALSPPWLDDSKTGIWRVRPVDLFLRHVLPRHGWKIPEDSDAGLTAAECARGQWLIVAGPESDPDQKQLLERTPATKALWSAEGTGRHLAAETALVAGDMRKAYDHYRDILDDDQGSTWVKDRLLQIGAADHELTLETRQLAEEILAEESDNVQALLALGAIAVREQAFAEAAARYAALAEYSRKHRERFDAIAAELAAAESSTPIDPGGALAAYERAAARARDSVAAHRALMQLRANSGDWAGSVQAGERLVKLETEAGRRAGIHRQLGVMCRSQLGDLKRARLHFERALRIVPDDPLALEGLAETFAARGEPARAAGYLARLADQAEHHGTPQRIAQLNLRLGQIWERWLGDRESAAGRYLRVLEADDKNRTARLRLAALAEAGGDFKEARTYYEDLLADEEQAGVDPEAIPDLVSAYTRLAHVTLASEGPTSEVVASLERAVELDPTDRMARDELSRVLRSRDEGDRLLGLLGEWLRVDLEPDDARRMHMLAAQIHLQQPGGYSEARIHLEHVLDAQPDDPDALELVLPVLEDEGDVGALTQRLAAAADATAEPVKRADFLYRLSMARAKLGLGAGARLAPLEDALQANPYHLPAATEALHLLRDNDDKERLANMLECVAVAATEGSVRVTAQRERAALLWKVLGRPEEAEAALRETLAADPDQVHGWLDLAAIQDERGMQQAARETLVRVIEQHELPPEDRAPIHRRLAELAAAHSDSEEQAIQLKALIACGVVEAEVTDALTEVLEALGRRMELAEHLEAWGRENLGGQRDALLARAGTIFKGLGENERAANILAEVMHSAAERDQALAAAVALESLARELQDVSRAAEAIELQIERAVPQENAADPRLQHFARLIDTYAGFGDCVAASATCRRLLDLEPLSIKAHTFLAECAEQENAFSTVLDHLSPLVLEAQADESAWKPEHKRAVFEQAMALALEIGAPSLIQQLSARFLEVYPDVEDDDRKTLSRPFALVLREREAWPALLALREQQLLSGSRNDPQHTLEVADLLYRHLGRPNEAVMHYETVLQVDPQNVQAEGALSELYLEFVRYGDYCKLQLDIAGTAEDSARAIAAALLGFKVAHEETQDLAVRDEILNVVSRRDDISPDHEELLAALKAAGLLETWVSLRERSLDAQPDAVDGRFEELIGVLVMELNDTSRAIHWSQKLAHAVPEVDTAWRAWLNLLGDATDGEHSDTLDEEAALASADVLRAWVSYREGEPKTELLLELAETLCVLRPEEAVDALREASATSPTSEVVLSQLTTALLNLDRTVEAVEVLQQLAVLYDSGEQKNVVLRRIVDVDTHTGEGLDRVIHALAAIVGRTEEETALFAQLLVRAGRFNALLEHNIAPSLLSNVELAQAAVGLAAATEFDASMRFFSAALGECTDEEEAEQLWEVIEPLWRAAGLELQLGSWRIRWSAQPGVRELQPVALIVRLRGMTELLDHYAHEDTLAAGVSALRALGVDHEQDFERADLLAFEQGALVFGLAQRLDEREWANRAANALESVSATSGLDKALAVEVLKFRLQWEQDAGRAEDVVELSRKLLQQGEAWASAPLESALHAAGRLGELIEHLRLSAEASGDPVLWLRIAQLHVESSDWAAAQEALTLGRPAELTALLDILESDRAGVDGTLRAQAEQWATLWQRCGVEVGDAQLQVEGARALGVLCEEPRTRGRWLRDAGRIEWWQLGKVDVGHALLVRAQELDTLVLQDIEDDLEMLEVQGDYLGMARRLEEAVVFMPAALRGALLLRWAELHRRQDDQEDALQVVRRAIETLSEDAQEWQQFAELATGLGDTTLSIEAWRGAYGAERAHEDAYFSALHRAERYEALAEALETRASEIGASAPEDSAERYQRAGAILRDRLEDSVRALDLFGAAVRMASSEENLLATYELSVALNRQPAVAAIGPRLLNTLESNYPERPEILRSTVDALVAAASYDEALPFWRELIARDLGTAEDYRVYAETVAEMAPAEAAAYFDIAAEKFKEAGGDNVGQMRFLAAELWIGLHESAQIKDSLSAALEEGLDGLEVHLLAEAHLDGDRRLTSVRRLIELGGDVEMDADHRVDMRLDLAAAFLAGGDAAAALSQLQDARTWAQPPRWVHLYEQCIQAGGGVNDATEARLALAHLWIDSSTLTPEPWSVEDYLPRMREAAEVFRAQAEPTSELAALEKLSAWEPDNLDVQNRMTEVAAEIGDADQLDVQIRQQLARLTDAYAKDQLAARYCPLFAQQFQRMDLALGLAQAVFSERASLSVAQLLVDLLEQGPENTDYAMWRERLCVAAIDGAASEPPLDAQVRVQIFEQALRLTAQETDVQAAESIVYTNIIRIAPGHADALQWLVKSAAERESWTEQLQLYLNAAEVLEGDVRRACLENAAALHRERLDNASGEMEILRRLHEEWPNDNALAAQFADAAILCGQALEAKRALMGGAIRATQAVPLASKLAEILHAEGEVAAAQETLDWATESFPHSLLASDVRLQRARDKGEALGLLDEIIIRLEHPATFDAQEVAQLSAEAGDLCRVLGRSEDAVLYYGRAAEVGVLPAHTLMLAYVCAIKGAPADSADSSEALSFLQAFAEAGEPAEAVCTSLLEAEHTVELAGGVALSAEERMVALLGLAQLKQSSGDTSSAIEIHERLVELSVASVPALSSATLVAHYQGQERWLDLCNLYERLAQDQEAKGRAELYYRAGFVARDRLRDTTLARRYFDAVLVDSPEHLGAQRGLGLLLAAGEEFAAALPLLQHTLKGREADASTNDLLLFISTLRHGDDTLQDMLNVTAEVLRREPLRTELHAERASALERAEQREDAEIAWVAYLEAMGDGASQDDKKSIVSILQRVSAWAGERNDQHLALERVRRALVVAGEVYEEQSEIIRALWQDVLRLSQLEGQVAEVAEAHLALAGCAGEPKTAVQHLQAASTLFKDVLADEVKATHCLERAVELQPDNVELLLELLARHDAAAAWDRYLVVGERVLALVPEEDLQADFFARLARAYQEAAQDPGRAKEFYTKASKRDPTNVHLHEKRRELAQLSGDFETLAEAEEAVIETLEDVPEKVQRLRDLAEVYLRHLNSLPKAATALARAHQLAPDDVELKRRLADTYALEEKFYDRAALLYEEVIADDPLNAEVVRIRARLAGQTDDTDRAYGFYAALLALEPQDQEAREYVEACRHGRNLVPQRAITDADRVQGLLHTEQQGAIEGLFAPLARFAELTKPGDLKRRGLGPADVVVDGTSLFNSVAPVLTRLGVEDAVFYRWSAGGYAVEAELVGQPTFLIGAQVAQNERDAAFLTARAAELYRTGHTLCERMSEFELAGLLAALCIAVEPHSQPPGINTDTQGWAEIIGTPMTDEIRAHLAPMVLSFLAGGAASDIGAWRRAARISASRTALLLSCDLDEALSAIVRSRGFDDITDEQKVAVIRELPEAVELMRFALSEPYFRLRQSLGLALRKS